MLHFRVCLKLVCCLWVCHGLEARLCILPFILDLLWSEPFSDLPFFMACFLQGLGLAWLWAFLPFSSLFAPSVGLLVFLPHHPTIPAVVLFDLCLLGIFWACCMLFFYLIMVTHHCYWVFIHATWAFLTHYIACWLPWPFSLIGHPRPNFNSAFTWVFTNSFGLFRPSYYILHLWSSWVSINPILTYFITLALLWPILIFLHHIILMSLLLFSLGSFRPICFSQDSFIYFMGLWSIIPAIRA